MLLLPIYVLLGLADRWATLVLGPSNDGQGSPAERSQGHGSAGVALLLLAGGLLLVGAVLPFAGPPVMTGLQPLGAKGLVAATGALVLGLLGFMVYALVRYLAACRETGKAIYHGVRRPAWRR